MVTSRLSGTREMERERDAASTEVDGEGRPGCSAATVWRGNEEVRESGTFGGVGGADTGDILLAAGSAASLYSVLIRVVAGAAYFRVARQWRVG
jgi:hypothetical protein